MKTRKPTRLPIVDIKLKDVGNPRQKVKIEVGQVCFSLGPLSHHGLPPLTAIS